MWKFYVSRWIHRVCWLFTPFLTRRRDGTHTITHPLLLFWSTQSFFFFSFFWASRVFISLNQHLLTGNGSHNVSGFPILWVGVAVHTEPGSISKSVTTIIYSWEYLGKPKILESVIGEKPWVRIWDTFFQDTALRGETLSSYFPPPAVESRAPLSPLTSQFPSCWNERAGSTFSAVHWWCTALAVSKWLKDYDYSPFLFILIMYYLSFV